MSFCNESRLTTPYAYYVQGCRSRGSRGGGGHGPSRYGKKTQISTSGPDYAHQIPIGPPDIQPSYGPAVCGGRQKRHF